MFFLSENGDRCGVFIIFCLFTYCFMRFYACYYQNLTVLLPRIMRAYAFTVSIILARESIVILNYKGISLTTIAALWSAHELTVSLKTVTLHVFLLMCHHRRRTCGAGRRRARQREELFGNSSGILFHIYPYSVHVFHWISTQLIQPTARTCL